MISHRRVLMTNIFNSVIFISSENSLFALRKNGQFFNHVMESNRVLISLQNG